MATCNYGCHQNTVSNETVELDISTTEIVKPILSLNCPVILTAQHVGVSRWRENPSLSFRLIKNLDYDEGLEDTCKGDMKNIWPSLMRFQNEIENDLPYINDLSGISRNIEHFPKTFKEVKNHVNSDALDSSLDAKRGIHFLRKSLNEYWLENHGPIIEDVLLKYDLKLRLYDQEKPKFCYHRDNIEYCNCYPWGIGRELELSLIHI